MAVTASEHRRVASRRAIPLLGRARPGPHDGPLPDALYACALPGSFGAPCTVSASGADPAECTDPAYSQCFVGGQGAWCTKLCTGAADCTATSDAGCSPTSCNVRGYCK
jgi:hypothetical protein